jgi:hypothetical protein
MIKKVFKFFDIFEDVVRSSLSHFPIFYSLVGGTGVILFWRGIWRIADFLEAKSGVLAILFSPLGSMAIGVSVLLATGLFVSVFIGDKIIMSGITKDKKIIEKTKDEIIEEEDRLKILQTHVTHIEKTLDLPKRHKKDKKEVKV